MASGDGFEKFVHASLSRLVLHVVKLGGSVDEAKDAVSEALADAWHSRRVRHVRMCWLMML